MKHMLMLDTTYDKAMAAMLEHLTLCKGKLISHSVIKEGRIWYVSYVYSDQS